VEKYEEQKQIYEANVGLNLPYFSVCPSCAGILLFHNSLIIYNFWCAGDEARDRSEKTLRSWNKAVALANVAYEEQKKKKAEDKKKADMKKKTDKKEKIEDEKTKDGKQKEEKKNEGKGDDKKKKIVEKKKEVKTANVTMKKGNGAETPKGGDGKGRKDDKVRKDDNTQKDDKGRKVEKKVVVTVKASPGKTPVSAKTLETKMVKGDGGNESKKGEKRPASNDKRGTEKKLKKTPDTDESTPPVAVKKKRKVSILLHCVQCDLQ
jgi:hypothetical protein